MAKPAPTILWFPRRNSKRRERAGSHSTTPLIFAPCSCCPRSFPRTSSAAQRRPRISPMIKAGLRCRSISPASCLARSPSPTSATLPARWGRAPLSAVWKDCSRRNLPKEALRRLLHRDNNHLSLRKKRKKVQKTKSFASSKNASGSKALCSIARLFRNPRFRLGFSGNQRVVLAGSDQIRLSSHSQKMSSLSLWR
jgi:hypothetical protein